MYKLTSLVLTFAVCATLGHAAAPCDKFWQLDEKYDVCARQLYGAFTNLDGAAFKNKMNTACTKEAKTYVTCMMTPFDSCDAVVKRVIDNNVQAHKNLVCEGDSLKSSIKSLLDTMVSMFISGTQLQCFHTAQVGTNMRFCLQDNGITNATSTTSILQKSITAGLPILAKINRNQFICMRRVLRAHSNCSNNEISAYLNFYMLRNAAADLKAQDLLPATDVKPRQGTRVTLAAFGDPHLVVYKQSNIITCSAPGKQVYLENDFILITATNTFVSNTSTASIITSLRVELMNKTGKVVAKYSAANSLLPDSFDGGKSKIIIDGKEAEVEMLSRLMSIKAPSAGLAIYVSKYKHMYPLMLVRGSEAVFGGSSGLLVDGCVDTVSRTSVRRKRATTAECDTACAAQTKAERKEICKFDCVQTNDAAFAKQASEDLGSAEEAAILIDEAMSGSGANKVTWLLVVMAIMLVCMN